MNVPLNLTVPYRGVRQLYHDAHYYAAHQQSKRLAVKISSICLFLSSSAKLFFNNFV